MRFTVCALACLATMSAFAVGQKADARDRNGIATAFQGQRSSLESRLKELERRTAEYRIQEQQVLDQKAMAQFQLQAALFSVIQNEVVLMQALQRPVDVLVVGLPDCVVKITISAEIIPNSASGQNGSVAYATGPRTLTLNQPYCEPSPLFTAPFKAAPRPPEFVAMPPVSDAEKNRAQSAAGRAIRSFSLGF